MEVKVRTLRDWEGALKLRTRRTDQATGSTHCVLAPYWSAKLGTSCMKVKQVSERTGEAEVESIVSDGGGYVSLMGSGVLVMEGKVLVPRVPRFDPKL